MVFWIYFRLGILLILATLQSTEACCWCVPTPQYVFLRTSPVDAFHAFGRIIANSYTTPRNQLSGKMQEWAEQYNMTEELQNYETRSEQIRADTDNTISTILSQLQNFMADVQSIRNDQTLSQEEADRRTKSLFDSANRNLATVACCLLNTVSSSQNTMPVSYAYTYGPVSVGVYTSTLIRNRRMHLSNSEEDDSAAATIRRS